MVRSIVVLLACLLIAPTVAGHAYNHGTRHEDCQSYEDPASHNIADGHAHWHHIGPAGAHLHDGVFYPAGHTHADTLHDPCNQTGMHRPAWSDAAPLDEIPVADAVIDNDPLAENIVVRGEAYKMPVTSFQKQRDLVVRGDAVLAAMGFPGSGTEQDPYVIEGYHITNVLQIKDTSACIVVRDNVVHSDAILGELIDPNDVIDPMATVRSLQARIDAAEAELEAAEDLLGELRDDLDEALEELADAAARLAEARQNASPWEDALADAVQDRADAAAQATQADQASQAAADALAVMQSAVAAKRQALADAEAHTQAADDTWQAAVDAHEEAQDDFEDFASGHTPPQRDYVGSNGEAAPTAMRAFVDAYEDFVGDVEPADEAAQATYDALKEDLEDAADDVDVAAAALEAAEAAEAQADLSLVRTLLLEAAADTMAQAAADAAAEAADALDDADAVLTAARAEYTPYQAAEQEAEAAHAVAEAAVADARRLADGAQDDVDDIEADLKDLRQKHQQALLDAGDGHITYLGEEYEDLQALVDATLEPLLEALDPSLAGRLILDWNGPCVHAYNNVVEDLRVNRNNQRTGYVTGGTIEDNRIHTVGQIRHFDGEFRQNEVGDRDHVRALIDGTGIAAPINDRAINVDGANQGWFHDNVIMGGVDLDFHGHHHGAGFFAPESHYHGSDERVAYMYNSAGTCAQPGMHHGSPTMMQNVTMMLGLTHPHSQCLPHHNHHKRWTSMTFEENVLIDPAGKGLRYEDRNHEGDDREANSEDMHELNMPHFHETDIRIADNAIVGGIMIDVFNAPGVMVWSDDYDEAVEGTAAEEAIDAAKHLGAQRVPSHPVRNTGYLDLDGNAIHVTGRAHAILVSDIDAAERLDITGNRAWVLPEDWSVSLDRVNTTALIGKGVTSAPHTHQNDLGPVGRPGTQTGIELRHAQDSNAQVCGNTVLGFDRGLQATRGVMSNVAIQTCSNNDWGGATVDVAFTSPTTSQPGITSPVRPMTSGTVVGPVTDPVLDDVDDAAAPGQQAAAQTVATAGGLI